MIVTPKNGTEWQVLSGFLLKLANVQPSHDLHCIGWVSEGKLVIVVGFSAFLGKTAQMHVAFAPGWHFAPRTLLGYVFSHAFNETKRELLIGVVNSLNVRAMRLNLHLGFTELLRLPGMHDDGGDLVVLGMKRSECRYLNEPTAVPVTATGSA